MRQFASPVPAGTRLGDPVLPTAQTGKRLAHHACSTATPEFSSLSPVVNAVLQSRRMQRFSVELHGGPDANQCEYQKSSELGELEGRLRLRRRNRFQSRHFHKSCTINTNTFKYSAITAVIT